MNTTENRFQTIASINGQSFPTLFSADADRANAQYFELFHELMTAPKLMDGFSLQLFDGDTLIRESTPNIRAGLRFQADIEAGLTFLAAHS